MTDQVFEALCKYPQAPREAFEKLKHLKNLDEGGFCLAALGLCGGTSPSSLGNIAGYLILSCDFLWKFPCKLGRAALPQAMHLFRDWKKLDSLLDLKLWNYLIDIALDQEQTETLGTNENLLALIPVVAEPERAVEPLTILAQISDPQLRSRVALTAGIIPDSQSIRLYLEDENDRVRANVIESLWRSPSASARGYFEAALNDSCHRVKANALIGLYFVGDARGAEGLTQLVSSDSPLVRSSAAWAIGAIGESHLEPLLERLLTDPEPQVARNAERAHTQLHVFRTNLELEKVRRNLAGHRAAG